MTDVYYKVVRKNNKGLLVSAVATNAAKIVYKPYGWTAARRSFSKIGQDICVFDDYEEARGFALAIIAPGECLQVWACECENLHDPATFVPLEVFDYYKKVSDVVESIIGRRTQNGQLTLWPYGTMMAKRIHLKGLLFECK